MEEEIGMLGVHTLLVDVDARILALNLIFK